MERYELKRDDPAEALVAAADLAGEIAVTRDGNVVARVRREPFLSGSPGKAIDLAALARLRASIPPEMRVHDAGALVRDMREMDDR